MAAQASFQSPEWPYFTAMTSILQDHVEDLADMKRLGEAVVEILRRVDQTLKNESKDDPGARPWLEIQDAYRKFLAATESRVQQNDPRPFLPSETVACLTFRNACYQFADAVLDILGQRAAMFEETGDIPPLPIEDDVLGKLFWPCSSYSRDQPAFMPYREREGVLAQ